MTKPRVTFQEVSTPPFSLQGLEALGVEGVCTWLASIDGAGRYVDLFRQHHIDGAVLVTLDERDLKEEIGVMELGIRRRISRALGKDTGVQSPRDVGPTSQSVGVPRIDVACIGRERGNVEALCEDAERWRHARRVAPPVSETHPPPHLIPQPSAGRSSFEVRFAASPGGLSTPKKSVSTAATHPHMLSPRSTTSLPPMPFASPILHDSSVSDRTTASLILRGERITVEVPGA